MTGFYLWLAGLDTISQVVMLVAIMDCGAIMACGAALALVIRRRPRTCAKVARVLATHQRVDDGSCACGRFGAPVDTWDLVTPHARHVAEIACRVTP